jgi:hypothetical protein
MQNQVIREEFSFKAKEKMKIFQANKIALEFYQTITL